MRYYHIIRSRKRKAAGLTLAVEARITGSGRIFVECGVAYCAPVERNFSRPLGRTISSMRLQTEKAVPAYKKFEFETMSLDGLKMKALTHLLHNNPPIEWARRLIAKEIDALGTKWALRQCSAPSRRRLVAKKIRRIRNGVSAQINARIKEIIAGEPGSTRSHILLQRGFEGVKTPRKAVGYQLKHLTDLGQVRREGAGRKNDPYRYFLA